MITMQIRWTDIIVFMLIDSSSDPIHNLPSVVTRTGFNSLRQEVGQIAAQREADKARGCGSAEPSGDCVLHQYNLGRGSSCDWGT